MKTESGVVEGLQAIFQDLLRTVEETRRVWFRKDWLGLFAQEEDMTCSWEFFKANASKEDCRGRFCLNGRNIFKMAWLP